jgi:hypothetical protein
MGSAPVQGQLWGMHARDFATYLEQSGLPLSGAVLDAAHVVPGTRLLDAGCGAPRPAGQPPRGAGDRPRRRSQCL